MLPNLRLLKLKFYKNGTIKYYFTNTELSQRTLLQTEN